MGDMKEIKEYKYEKGIDKIQDLPRYAAEGGSDHRPRQRAAQCDGVFAAEYPLPIDDAPAHS